MDSKGLTVCQNYVLGEEMEVKQRSTTSGTEKLGRRGHLLLLPPSAWADAITRLFSQVHFFFVCPSHVFLIFKPLGHFRELCGCITPPG